MSWMGHDAGVQSVYYLPTQEQIKAEIEKAEKALRIFGRVEVSEDRVARLEAEIAALRGTVSLLGRLLDRGLG
jgi:tRNA A58 N-methylase Trm61